MCPQESRRTEDILRDKTKKKAAKGQRRGNRRDNGFSGNHGQPLRVAPVSMALTKSSRVGKGGYGRPSTSGQAPLIAATGGRPPDPQAGSGSPSPIGRPEYISLSLTSFSRFSFVSPRERDRTSTTWQFWLLDGAYYAIIISRLLPTLLGPHFLHVFFLSLECSFFYRP